MFATVRRYEGVTNPAEASKRVNEGFVPLISTMPGFLAYYWIDIGHNTMLSVSIFSSLSKAIESNAKAATWVRTNLKPIMPKEPIVDSGAVLANK